MNDHGTHRFVQIIALLGCLVGGGYGTSVAFGVGFNHPTFSLAFGSVVAGLLVAGFGLGLALERLDIPAIATSGFYSISMILFTLTLGGWDPAWITICLGMIVSTKIGAYLSRSKRNQRDIDQNTK
jgi:hypothetical protein